MFRSTFQMLVSFALAAAVSACSHDTDLTRVDRYNDKLPYIRELGWLKDGNKHGQWQYYRRGKLDEIEHWRIGQRHGLTVMFHSDGSVAHDAWWRRGKLHGRERYFYDNGRLAELGWFRNYKQEGLFCEWHPHEDRLEKLTEYRRGRIVREVENPRGDCPHTVGDGRRHKDPSNRDYRWRKPGKLFERPLPIH